MKKIKLLIVGILLLMSCGLSTAADKPVSQLTEATAIAADDLLLISYYSGGNYYSRKVLFSTLQSYVMAITEASALNLGTSQTHDGKIIFRSGTALNDYLFTIQASNFGSNLTWTLPTAAPGGANYLLNVDADGTMGYTDPSTFLNSTDIGVSIQGQNSYLDLIAAGGAANTLYGVNAAGTQGFYSQHAHDGSAAQFFDATDGTKQVKIDPVGMTTGKTFTMKTSFDQSATFEIKNTGLSADSKTITLDAACTDDCTITTPAATDTLVGKATTDTLTNKTLDVDGTGNVVKSWGYLILTHPHLCGAGAPMQTTSTARTYGHCKFGNATDKATNYAEYSLVVPADIDTSVDLVGTFKFVLSAADTADHEYEISFDSVADSAAWAGSLGDAVSLAYTADASGAEGDVETATGTLTGWRSAMTAGDVMIIRVARDGDHATDASAVDSYSGPLVIKYKITQ